MSSITNDDNVMVIVKDNGVGMSEDITYKIFIPGNIITAEGTMREKGTGLGLILCKDLVEKNNGKIWVESKPGEGSSFYFTLPANPPA
jgi:signal transduction histidine kinase